MLHRSSPWIQYRRCGVGLAVDLGVEPDDEWPEPRKIPRLKWESVLLGDGFMRKSRFSEEQIIAILRKQEQGRPMREVCRQHGISANTFYRWKAKYGGMDVSGARKLRSFEDENARLKKLLAEEMLDNTVPERLAGKVLLTPQQRRDAALDVIKGHDFYQRRACRLVSVDRKTVRRNRPRDNPQIRDSMRETAAERRRFGWRRIGLMLARESTRNAPPDPGTRPGENRSRA